MKNQEFSFDELRSFCSVHLQSQRNQDLKYSLRKFAREADIPVSTMSKFINGQMGITKPQVISVCKVMNLSHAKAIMFSRSLKANEKINSVKLNSSQISSELNHPLVDALIESLDSAEVDIDAWLELGSYLGFSNQESKSILKLAVSHKLILGPNEEGLYKRAEGHFDFLDEQNRKSIEAKAYQKEMLNLSSKALEQVDLKNRSHTSVVLNLDVEDLEAAIHYLAEHNEDFLSIFRQKKSQSTKPYALQVSFFPLSKGMQNEK